MSWLRQVYRATSHRLLFRMQYVFSLVVQLFAQQLYQLAQLVAVDEDHIAFLLLFLPKQDAVFFGSIEFDIAQCYGLVQPYNPSWLI